MLTHAQIALIVRGAADDIDVHSHDRGLMLLVMDRLRRLAISIEPHNDEPPAS